MCTIFYSYVSQKIILSHLSILKYTFKYEVFLKSIHFKDAFMNFSKMKMDPNATQGQILIAFSKLY